MKKIVYLISGFILFAIIAGLFFNKLIFQSIVHKQAESLCKNITFDGGYKIDGSGFTVIAKNVVCSQKENSIKIKRISILYKTDTMISWLFGSSKLVGSVKLIKPDINLSLSRLKASSNITDIGKGMVLSKVINGKIRLNIGGRIIYINDISTFGDKIKARIKYENYNADLVYLKKNNRLVLSFKNLNSSILKQFQFPKQLKIGSLSGRFNYDLVSNKGILKASVGKIEVDPYFDINGAAVRLIVDPLKSEYKGKIFVWKGSNRLTLNIYGKGKNFRLTARNYFADAAFLSSSSKKLRAVFDEYKIAGKAVIKMILIKGNINRLKQISVSAAGRAYDASFRITPDTPLFDKSSGNFTLKDNNLDLTNLKGDLGSSFVSRGVIRIKNLFSKPSAAITLSVKLDLDDVARKMTNNLFHDDHLVFLFKYADKMTGLMHISIRKYRFRPKPYFPFLIDIRDVGISNYDRKVKLTSSLVLIERKANIVKINGYNIKFDTPDMQAKLSAFINIPSDNPKNSSTTLTGSLKAGSLKMVSPLLKLPYSGSLKIVIGKNILVQFDGLTKKKLLGIESIVTLKGSIVISGKDKSKYSGRLLMNLDNNILSYNANVGIQNKIISIKGKGKLVGGNFAANGFYAMKNRYWHIDLKSSSIMLDKLLKLINKRTNTVGSFGEGTMDINMDNTYYKKLVFPLITAKLSFDKGFVTSKDFKIRFINASAKGDLLYSQYAKYIKCNFSYAGTNDNLMIDQLGLNGEFIAKKISLKGSFLIPADGPASASIRYNATDGKIEKFPSLSKLLHYLSVKNILTLNFTNIIKRGLKFNQIHGSLALENGVLLTVNPLVMTGDLNMVFIGKYYIDKGNVDGILGIKTFALINKIVSHVPIVGWILTGKDKSFSVLSFSVKGKINKPYILPLPVESIGGGLLNIIERSLTFPFKLIK